MIVNENVIVQAQIARQKLTAMGLAFLLKAIHSIGKLWNLTSKKSVAEIDIPAKSPQKAPLPLMRFENMPKRIVANSGAFTIENKACMYSMMDGMVIAQ